MYESEIIEASNFDKVKTEYYVENLLENEDLSKDYDMDGNRGYYYPLTTKRKKLWWIKMLCSKNHA